MTFADASECRNCGAADPDTAAGLCASCHRKSTVLLSRRADGDGYQCSLCTLAGCATRLDPGDRPDHLREVHDAVPSDRLSVIREHERLVACLDRDDDQSDLGGWSE